MAQLHQIEVKSEALEQYLSSPGTPAPRRLLGAELCEHLTVAMKPRTFILAPQGHPHRVLALWRLTRNAAIILGICAEDETLDDATEPGMDASARFQGYSAKHDPWTNPTKPRSIYSKQPIIRQATAQEILYHYYPGGLPLLPPEEPHAATRWCAAMTRLAFCIGIYPRTKHIEYLFDPDAAYRCKISSTDIMRFEELMVDETQRLIIECGERPAAELLRTRYNFARKEALGIIRLARADALTHASSSIEEDRALMVAALQNLIARSKEEMNSDKELRALKELAKIQGLTRSEPEDMAKSFMQVIANTARQQDTQALNAQTRLLPEKVLDSEYSVVPSEDEEEDEIFDEEALAQFDKESS